MQLESKETNEKSCFTLLELLLVLGIATVIMTLILPKVIKAPAGPDVRRTITEVKRPFQEAALCARATGQVVELTLNPDSNTFSWQSAGNEAAASDADSFFKDSANEAQTSSGRKKYEFSKKVVFECGQFDEPEEMKWLFFPNGEATNLELVVSYRNRSFSFSVDPVTSKTTAVEVY